jgi:hypothetical protein
VKPSVRASFVGISALVALLALAPGAALANTPADQAGLKVDWHLAPSSGLGKTEQFPASAYAKGAYVVSDVTFEGGRILVSTDGLNWSVAWRGNNPPSFIVPGGPGFVAWSSGILLSNGGHKWTRANQGVPSRLLNSNFPHLGSVGGTVVAFPDSGHGYWSVDGLNWHAIANGSGPEGPITVAGDGMHLWAMTGGWDFNSGTGTPVQVWVTSNGKSWAKSAELPNSHHVSGLTAAFGPNGGVAIGGTRSWFSADDVHWHLATNTPTRTVKGRDFVDAVVADVSGFIATAHRDPPGCVLDPTQRRALTWTSVDGKIWREMPERGWLGKEIDQLFITGRTLLGVGIIWMDDPGSGAVWRAQLPTIASDNAPPPGPLPNPGPQGCGP